MTTFYRSFEKQNRRILKKRNSYFDSLLFDKQWEECHSSESDAMAHGRQDIFYRLFS